MILKRKDKDLFFLFLSLLHNSSMNKNKKTKTKEPRDPGLTKVIWGFRIIILSVIALGVTLSGSAWDGIL